MFINFNSCNININFFILLLISIIIPPSFLISYIIISAEKRTEEIEKSMPDFLRQVSAILKAGMSLELKKERKSTVMMSVTFLVISAEIAASFTL